VNHMTIFKALVPLVMTMSLIACKPGDAKKEGKTLAEVDGKVITTEDFKNEVERLPPYLKPMVQSTEGRKELLDSMIVRQILLEQAKKDGVDKSKEVSDRLDDLRKRLIVETYLKKKVEQEAQVTDEEMKKFYDENKEKFKTGDQVRASHILVKTEKEAQDILAQLKQGGKFEELAKKFSADSSAAKGGDLGWFPKGAMVPEFEKTAFSLKEGEMSGVVKTNFGFHIIKVTGKRPAGIRTLDEMKDQIKANLLPAKQQQIFQGMKDNLKKNAKITINEEALKGIDFSAAGENAETATSKQPAAAK
jgi:peptidyl-prolyl cis-trans isomerase C